MNTNQNPGDEDKLEAPARQARQYAAHMVRTTRSVPPSVITGTGEGLIFPTIFSGLS